jgi:hypothetical protein
MFLLVSAAFAREVVHRARPVDPPEAFYVLDGLTTCEVTVVVAPNGVPVDARPETCPDVLGPALREAALRWRWTGAVDTTAESVEIAIRPPAFTPHPRRHGVCRAAISVDRGHPQAISPIAPGCDFTLDAVAAVATDGLKRPAWCAVRVTTDRDGQARTALGECADGFEDVALAAVERWEFPRNREWQVLVAFPPPPPPRPIDFR